jgi:hypothetical protein
MRQIIDDDLLYAVLIEKEDHTEGTKWYGNKYESLQCSTMNYPKDKEWRRHRHLLNPRIIKYSQECFICISGLLQVVISDKAGTTLGTFQAKAGEAIIVYRGGHAVKCLKDTVAYEVKAGSFTYVSEDKEYID